MVGTSFEPAARTGAGAQAQGPAVIIPTRPAVEELAEIEHCSLIDSPEKSRQLVSLANSSDGGEVDGDGNAILVQQNAWRHDIKDCPGSCSLEEMVRGPNADHSKPDTVVDE